jgi:hypothetical protein
MRARTSYDLLVLLGGQIAVKGFDERLCEAGMQAIVLKGQFSTIKEQTLTVEPESFT